MFRRYKSLSKISFVGAGNILNSLIGFVFITAVAKSLSLEDFGKYSLITSLLVSISKLVDFGTNSIYVAKSISTDDHKITDYFYSLKIFLLILTVPISFIALILLNVFDLKIFLFFLIGLVAYGFNYTLYALFQKNEKYTQLVLLNTLPALTKGIAAVGLFLGIINSDIPVVFAIFAGSVATCMILIPFVPSELKRFSFKIKDSLSMLKESLSPGVSLTIYEAWPAINNAIAKMASGFSEVGIFSLANKISNVFSLVSLAIFTVLLPRNATRKKKKLSYDFGETTLLGIGLIVMSIAAIIASEVFITAVFGDKFSGSIKLLDLLIFAGAITAIQSFLENYFYVEEKTIFLGSINFIRLLSFLVLAFILVGTSNLQGLALANLISALIGLGITIWVIKILDGRTKVTTEL